MNKYPVYTIETHTGHIWAQLQKAWSDAENELAYLLHHLFFACKWKDNRDRCRKHKSFHSAHVSSVISCAVSLLFFTHFVAIKDAQWKWEMWKGENLALSVQKGRRGQRLQGINGTIISNQQNCS